MNLEMLKKWTSSFLPDARSNRNTFFLRAVLFLGILGMLLIGLSECSGTDAKKSDALPTSVESTDLTARELERQLLRVLEQMEGVGHVELFITMEGTGESVYAIEEKETADNESIYSDDGTLKSIQNSRSSEQNYLLVENQEGRQQALLISRSEPQVKGVIIICDGFTRKNGILPENVVYWLQ